MEIAEKTNLLLGYGKLYIDSIAIGNVPNIHVSYDSDNGYVLHWATDNINIHNLELFHGGEKSVIVDYESGSVAGYDIGLMTKREVLLMPELLDLRGDNNGGLVLLNFRVELGKCDPFNVIKTDD